MGAAVLDALDALDPIGVCHSLYIFWTWLPWKFVFFGHALFCCLAGPEFKNRWLVHLLLTYLWGNGGGLISALLIQDPSLAPLSFFQNDFIPGAWLAGWWLVNWCPGGHCYQVCSLPSIKGLLKSCTMLLRAQLICSRVDLAVKLFPGQVAPALILGTIAGCGGRLLADAIMTGWQSMSGLAELTSPGFASRSAACGAVAYYGLAHATGLLPPSAAAGLVVTALMLHCVASELTGLPLDFTEPLSQLLHTVTRVPLPPPQPHLVPAAAARGGRSPAAKQQGASTPAKSSTPVRSPGAPGSAKKGAPATAAGAAAAAAAAAAASPAATGRKGRGGNAAAAAAAVVADDNHGGEAYEEAQAPGTASKQLPKRATAARAATASGGDSEVVKGGAATRRSQRRAAAAAPAYA